LHVIDGENTIEGERLKIRNFDYFSSQVTHAKITIEEVRMIRRKAI